MRPSKRAGFTLIEVIAALGLTGFALLGCILLLDQLTDSASRITSARVMAGKTANGERLLRHVVLDAVPSVDTTHGLRGDARSTTFWSSCQVPDGWAEPCRVTLSTDWRGDSTLVFGEIEDGSTLVLLRQADSAEFRYVDGTSDTLWAERWSSNLTLPSALVLVTRRDTIVYPIAASHE